MAKINTAAIKRKLIAMRQRAPLLPADVEARQRAMMQIKKRAARKKLAPLFGKALDIAKANAILAQSHREQHSLATKRTPALVKANALLAERLRQGQANRAKALEVLNLPGLPFVPTVIPLKPFMIWAQPSNSLYDSSISPGASLAKAFFYSEQDGSYLTNSVTFYFLWTNPSAYYAVINAACSLAFRGNAQAEANTGIFDGGTSNLYGLGWLQPFEWWNQPPTQPMLEPSARKYFMGLNADGGGFWSMETGDVDMTMSFDGLDLRYDMLSIPPGGTMVFEVAAQFQYSIDDGYIQYDFARFANYGIICSALQIELLTSPEGLRQTAAAA